MGVYFPNLKKIALAISEIRAAKVWVFFLRFFLLLLFVYFAKFRNKTRMRAPIELKIGTLKGLIKVNLSTKFGRNPMNIHGGITDYSRKIRSKVYHAHRVNRLKE